MDRLSSDKPTSARYLTPEQKRKYQLAAELGLLPKLKQLGWAGLTAKETGQIGGRMKHYTSKGD